MEPAVSPSDLAPLRLPDPISWWPPAPGWWIVLACFCVLLAAGLIWWWRRRQASAYRRRALVRLTTLVSSSTSTVQDYNLLLKAVALQAFPQVDVAALHGDRWVSFLCESCPTLSAQTLAPLLLTYQRELPPPSAELINATTQWIKTHEVARV
jgi:hypothetical protein